VRALADAERIRRFMRALGADATRDVAVYFTGGATAVLIGWRETTIDVDIAIVPEDDGLLRALPGIKERLQVNVELASPADFIPVPSGWEDRSIFVAREGRATFYHFDPYAQVLAKLERSHRQDTEDVEELVAAGLVDPGRALGYFEQIEPELFRFPAINPRTFRRRVEEAFRGH
jgi:hypothetical protein